MPNERVGRNISAIMRRVSSRDTTPETLLRKALWSKGLRYRVCVEDLPGKPDIVLPARNLVIFIDGDYWHGNQWRLRGLDCLEDQFRETSSKQYWLSKIRRNIARDCAVTSVLLSSGWCVIRFWESQITRNLEKCVGMVIEIAEHGANITHQSLIPYKTVAEFFAGIGLMRMGLELQGWKTEFANDIDPQKREMYLSHFSGSEGILTPDDVHLTDPDDVPSVTLATASFPCNDLSLAGAREGLEGKSSSALWGFTHVIDKMSERRPPLILLENVAGFLTSHRGRDFESALRELNRLGYSVDSFLLDAAWFVPQSRQRLFVVGVYDGEYSDSYSIQPSEVSPSEVRPKALVEFIHSHPDIRWRIRPLPVPPKSESKLEDVLDLLPDDAKEWWSRERVDYLLNQMSPKHKAIAEQMIAGKDYTYCTVFRRIRSGRSMAELRTDGIAGCLRTPRGGSGRQILFKAGKGYSAARLLTPRECARLMGADNYWISVPLNQALFGFGDAVCVPVVEWIAEYYLNPLANELMHGCPLVARL